MGQYVGRERTALFKKKKLYFVSYTLNTCSFYYTTLNVCILIHESEGIVFLEISENRTPHVSIFSLTPPPPPRQARADRVPRRERGEQRSGGAIRGQVPQVSGEACRTVFFFLCCVKGSTAHHRLFLGLNIGLVSSCFLFFCVVHFFLLNVHSSNSKEIRKRDEKFMADVKAH